MGLTNAKLQLRNPRKPDRQPVEVDAMQIEEDGPLFRVAGGNVDVGRVSSDLHFFPSAFAAMICDAW